MALPPPYSTQFIVNTPDSLVFNFAVPEGAVAVVRDITLYQTVGGTVAVVDFQNSLEAPTCAFAVVTALGVPGSGQWTGRIVVPGGGYINLSLSELGSGPQVYVGGYLLTSA